MSRSGAVGEAQILATGPAGGDHDAPAPRWLIAGGALICAVALLMGRWSPARLFNFPVWETVPWYFDIRPPVVVCGLLIIVATRSNRPPPVVPRLVTLAVLFVVLVLLTLPLSADIGGINCQSEYCEQKAIDVLWLACFVFITFCLAQKPGFEELFYRWLFVLCMILALLGLRAALATVDPTYKGLTVLEGGRNVYSRILGVLAILALYYYLAAPRIVPRVFFIGLFGLSLALLMLTGSRGGTAASLFGLAVAAIVFRAPLRGVVAIGAAIGVGLLLAVESGLLDIFARYITDRYVEGVFGQLYLSNRDTLLMAGLALWSDHPLWGGGLGRFAELNTLSYPHNIFVELLAETGVVGTLLVLLPVVFLLAFIRQHWAAVDKRGVAVFTVYLVAAQVSGDIYDSRALILIPVVAACSVVARRSLQNRTTSLWSQSPAGKPA